MHRLLCLVSFAAVAAPLYGQDLARLPVEPSAVAGPDWLIDPGPYRAGVYRSADGKDLVLNNGLVRRVFRMAPNCATVALDNLVSGQSMLRGVKPEAYIELDGVRLPVGGLRGQPNYAFLRREWVDRMTADPHAFRLVGFEVGEPRAPFGWKRIRHHNKSAAWPPKGVAVRMDYGFPEASVWEIAKASTAPLGSDVGRRSLWATEFAGSAALDSKWRVHRSRAHVRSSFVNEGKVGEVMTPANTACFVERALPAGTRLVEATIDPGTDRSASWGPGLALVFGDRVVKFHLRTGDAAGASFAAFDGRRELTRIGGRQPVALDRPWDLRLVVDGGRVHLDARSKAQPWRRLHTLSTVGFGEPSAVRVGKLGLRGDAADFGTPGDLARLRVLRCAAYSALDAAALAAAEQRWSALRDVSVSVHYELYDGLPCVAKWITVRNGSKRRIVLDRFTSEVLAVVESESRVESRSGVPFTRPNMWVETDYATGGSNENGMRWSVHWVTDPEYRTQVNYLRRQRCLLECRPSVGPDQDLDPGETFTSFRSFVLLHDSWERGRNGLARRKMYRTIAPWTTENPLMMHVRFADWESVKRAIDQCAEVGFEMVILTFGSGFEIENDAPEYLAKMKRYADYAKSKGIEIGGYSLLSSRRVGGGNDVVSPPGERPAHGSCPALTSEWGQHYFQKLYAFFPKTGFSLLEHDGPYPGDFDITPRPPLQKGYKDSQWAQFWISAKFYRWCRERGIYTNTPDWYYLNGSTKCAMGYRETNWSLPRAQQVIHTRQNIFDGTWTKTPTMGWMFVPLTQYHGGGAAATVEPLSEHLDHYRLLLQCNLGAGVQACYRGPRLFDTDETKAMVKAQVDWFKQHRAILESDIIHAGSRRADGRDLDWILHANPRLADVGMLVVYNPLERRVDKEIEVDVYYTGARGAVDVVGGDGAVSRRPIDARCRVRLPVSIGARGVSQYRLRVVR